MINEKGGINGRKIVFITYDDGYAPPKTAELTRKLVESDNVLLIFNTLGTRTNGVIHKYLNERRVPHLFPVSGASKWRTRRSSRGPWASLQTTTPRA